MENSFEKTAVRVSWVSILGNTVLSVFKLLAGIFAQSSAMVSDAVHSASDVFSSFIVIIGIKMAARDSDDQHPYGHERMESVAAIVLSVLLCMTGLFIGHTALENLSGQSETPLQIPHTFALVAAVVSILSKEAMYRYTRHFAKKIDSGALMADAWHHRSDALSSVGALIGIAGARMGLPWLDPAASLLICLFILKAAVDIFISAINKMVDHAASPEEQADIAACVQQQPGVLGIQKLRTREFGNRLYVDLEVLADGSQTLFAGCAIGDQVHTAIEAAFPKVKHITVQVTGCASEAKAPEDASPAE